MKEIDLSDFWYLFGSNAKLFMQQNNLFKISYTTFLLFNFSKKF